MGRINYSTGNCSWLKKVRWFPWLVYSGRIESVSGNLGRYLVNLSYFCCAGLVNLTMLNLVWKPIVLQCVIPLHLQKTTFWTSATIICMTQKLKFCKVADLDFKKDGKPKDVKFIEHDFLKYISKYQPLKRVLCFHIAFLDIIFFYHFDMMQKYLHFI